MNTVTTNNNITNRLIELKQSEFKLLQALFFKFTGISLHQSKKPLVISRLAKILRQYQLDSFYQYYCLLKTKTLEDQEIHCFINQLTTHQTAFFREPKHFEFLTNTISRNFSTTPINIWSAACSTGEEAYSIAMSIHEQTQHQQWQLFASDVSEQVVTQARNRCYPRQSIDTIPMAYRLKYCLVGTGPKTTKMKLKRSLTKNIHFNTINLCAPLPPLPKFDFIFLRNVLIYFDPQAKQAIISRLVGKLNPNGYLLLGHSESLLNHPQLRQIQPTVYQLRS